MSLGSRSDGRIYEEANLTILHYAGKGLFRCEIDTYNPKKFERMFRDWVKARLERAEPSERKKLSAELETFLRSRVEVGEEGIGAIE